MTSSRGSFFILSIFFLLKFILRCLQNSVTIVFICNTKLVVCIKMKY